MAQGGNQTGVQVRNGALSHFFRPTRYKFNSREYIDDARLDRRT